MPASVCCSLDLSSECLFLPFNAAPEIVWQNAVQTEQIYLTIACSSWTPALPTEQSVPLATCSETPAEGATSVASAAASGPSAGQHSCDQVTSKFCSETDLISVTGLVCWRRWRMQEHESRSYLRQQTPYMLWQTRHGIMRIF